MTVRERNKIRSKLKSKSEFTKSKISGDVVRLKESLHDIILSFEKNKLNILALDDQNECIAKLRQKETMENDIFIVWKAWRYLLKGRGTG